MLEHDPAILTIIGPGGTGKTRFALELARLLAEDAEGGTLFVPLSAVRDPNLVHPAMAEALGAVGSEPAQIAARIGEKRTHVLLDNLEQLLPGAASALALLVDAAPSLRLIVTSREVLDVSAETRFDLPPLSAAEAVDLFLARARAVRPEITANDAVTTLCDRLDRLPLALELAAARTRLLDPERLLERLSARLDLPAPRDADERHATLRATIDWSFELLVPSEQELFAALAVFTGAWTLEAAEEVCDADLDSLASLLDKSLIRRRSDDRLWMLETIREFAETELLARHALALQVSGRHAQWVLAVAESAGLAIDDRALGRRPDHAIALAARDEIRRAIVWSTEHEPLLAARIVNALENFWATTAPAEGRAYGEALLLLADNLPAELRGPLLRGTGGLGIREGELELGEQRYREAIAAFTDVGDEASVVGLEARFAVHAGHYDDVDRARRLVADVRAANATIGNVMVEPQMLATLGELASREGDLEGALAYTRQAIAAAEVAGFDLWALWQLASELELVLDLGRPAEAEAPGRKGLRLARRLDDRRLSAWLLAGLALVALRRARLEQAGTLWGGFLAAQLEQPVLLPPDFDDFTGQLRDCRDARFLAGVEDGRLLPLDRVVELALGESQTVP